MLVNYQVNLYTWLISFIEIIGYLFLDIVMLDYGWFLIWIKMILELILVPGTMCDTRRVPLFHVCLSFPLSFQN